MKKIKPYSSINEATKVLDNGGRFYNVLTKAEDGVISKAELGKVGGIFNDKQKMMLFLELSISKLDEQTKGKVISKLEGNLQAVYQQHKAQVLLPSEANEKGIIASNAIVTGIPKLTETNSDIDGFIFVPIMVGSVMTMTMIPIVDEYDVYELRDEASSETFLIAHAKGKEKFPEKKIIVAGVIKELKPEKEGNEPLKKFLEAVYYMDVF
jgi:hypothetical protein